MNRQADWSVEEFRVVLESPDATPEDLAGQLPGRGVEAIKIVRHGIHAWHNGQNISMLSQRMLRVLDEGQERRACSVCRATI